MASRQGGAGASGTVPRAQDFPQIVPLGLSGLLVRFADRADEAANRAALAFRARLDAAELAGVHETATTLASVVVLFDPLDVAPADQRARLDDLLTERDWLAEDLPPGRRLWRIPAAFGGAAGPQLAEAADLAGLAPQVAIDQICAEKLRVLAIGFAPGQPYLGSLPPHWDIPRQSGLTPRVPVGALCVAVRQIVLFSVPSQTGWRQIGQAAFAAFRPHGDPAFPLRAGDEVQLVAVTQDRLEALQGSPDGGAERVPL